MAAPRIWRECQCCASGQTGLWQKSATSPTADTSASLRIILRAPALRQMRMVARSTLMHKHTVGPLPAGLGNRDCHTAQRLLITAPPPADMCATPGLPERRQVRAEHAGCALTGSLEHEASPRLAACRRGRSERHPRPPRGDAALAHPIGFVVQFAGLAPSSRRWSLNRLATLMGGCAPCWPMYSARPSALPAHRSWLVRVSRPVTLRSTWWVTTTRQPLMISEA